MHWHGSALRRAAHHLMCLAWVVGTAASALAQPASPAPAPSGLPPLHQFIGSDGLGVATIRRSHLEALWGRADVEKHMTPSAQNRDKRDWALLQYPSRGLTFTTAVGSYGERDPEIADAVFTEPFDGCTPQGLCLGMPQAAAMPIISSLYKIRGDYAASWGQSSANGGERMGRSYFASNRGWRHTHHLSFGFRDGRLHSISVQLQPTPFITRVQLGSVLSFLLLLAVGLAVDRVWRAIKPKTEEGLETVREVGVIGVGGALLGAGIVGAMLAFSVFASGDSYARLGGLLLGLGAASAAVFALLVFRASRVSAISRTANVILVLGLAALLIAKLF